MSHPKVILFYAFTPLADPAAVRLWQKTLCENLGIKGRLLISPHGINGTLGGELADLKTYVQKTKEFAAFKNIDFKWSDGTGNDFPRLMVKVKPELVAFGTPYDLEVNNRGVVGGGIHLKPHQVHKLVEERGDEVVFFDGRNSWEAKIGRFKNAVIPDTTTTRDFVAELDSGKYDHLKDKPIVTYCTGGIRCEILSSLMVKRGFKEVYQIDGGIVKYGMKFRDKGLWEGSLFMFDGRLNLDFSDEAKVIGECEKCTAPTKQYYNCARAYCHRLILLCDECAKLDPNKSCTHEVVNSELIRTTN
jgi:UPF0176 protein